MFIKWQDKATQDLTTYSTHLLNGLFLSVWAEPFSQKIEMDQLIYDHNNPFPACPNRIY